MNAASASPELKVNPVFTIPPSTTLRALLDERRARDLTLSLDEAIALIVPLCLDVKEHHDRGKRVHLHPSSVVSGPDGLARLSPDLGSKPTAPRDIACVAPELQSSLEPGDGRASVFSIGAILYESLTGEHVGPAMPRPREINPDLPEALEVLLSKALVGDASHRPDDLGALASAMYHVAPRKSIHPPEVDESRLDQTDEFEVDVRLSLLPPESMSKLAVATAVESAKHRASTSSHARALDPTARLAALKLRLESDPRPRYVIVKDRMDHGPFTAVEVLQQITSNAFVATDTLRDELSGQSRELHEWEEFAPFADQAALTREAVAETKQVAEIARSEKKAGVAKSLVGLLLVAAVLAVAGVWVFKKLGSRSDEVSVSDDPSITGGLEVSGGIRGQKRARHVGAGGAGGGGGGGAGGLSYEAALASNVQEVTIGGAKGGADLTDGQLNGPMRNASFVDACGAPSSMKVTVKVAVKMGRAVGVSVYTTPPNAGVAGCIDRAVRGISWPANPKMDSFTTSY